MVKLPIKFECGDIEFLYSLLNGNSIVSLAVNEGQTLSDTWWLLVTLKKGPRLIISARTTCVSSREEIGSLKVEFTKNIEERIPDSKNFIETDFSEFIIDTVSIVTYVNTLAQSEAGLYITDSKNRSIVIVCATPPGAVTVKCPNYTGDLDSEFDWNYYKLVRIHPGP